MSIENGVTIGPDDTNLKPIITEEGRVVAYRENMEAQGFIFVSNADESGEFKGGQIYINPAKEEYLLMPPQKDAPAGTSASLYKKSEDGTWVIIPGFDIHPLE